MSASEQAVLGCLLLNPEKFSLANQILDSDDFYYQNHSDIFEAFSYLHSIGSEADIVLLRDRLREIEADVDLSYLSELSECVAFAHNLSSYCKAVKEASLKRKVTKLLKSTLEEIDEAKDLLSKDVVAKLMKEALEIDTFQEDRFTMREALDLFKKNLDTPKELISLGFSELDEVSNGGVDKHSLVTVASDSGVGKTTFTSNMLVNKALLGEKCLYINLEIPVIDMIELIAPQLSDEELWLDYQKLVTAKEEDLEEIKDFVEEKLADLGIYFARNCYTLPEVIAQMDLHRIDYGCQSVFVDHIQLIEGAEEYTKYVGITKEFKRYPLRHGMPVILLCQLNDNRDKRADKEPRKTDLRGGGNLYQDSDVVLFLYRLAPEEQTVYCKLAKNRKGASGQAIYYEIGFDPKTRRTELQLLANRPELKEDEYVPKKKRKKQTNKEHKNTDDY